MTTSISGQIEIVVSNPPPFEVVVSPPAPIEVTVSNQEPISVTVNPAPLISVEVANPPALDVSVFNPPFIVLELSNNAFPGPQGIQGPPGLSGFLLTKTAAFDLSGHRVVQVNQDGLASYASNAVLGDSSRVVGLTTGASLAGSISSILTYGDLTEPSWNWITNLPIYLGQDGYLTQTPPAYPALFSLYMGFPVSPTTMFINIGSPIALMP